MDLVFLAHRPPFPPDKGDKIRSYNIIRHLARRGVKVRLLALADNAAELENRAPLESLCESVELFLLNPKRRQARALLSPLRGRPLSAGFFFSPALQQRFEQLLRGTHLDAIFCFCSPMAEYLLSSPALRSLQGSGRPKLLLDMVDVDSEKWREYSRNRKSPMWPVHALEGQLLGAYEKRLCSFFDKIYLVSEAEADLLRRGSGISRGICAMTNGVDLDWFRPTQTSPIPGKISFCGAMDYPPNVHAVRWFAKKVLPLIREQVPHAVFSIVGREPRPEVRELSAIQGVTVTGQVPDVRPHVWSSSLSVAPLHIARGIQNKVLEAMAMGRAVLCTPESLEGIRATPGEELEVCKADPAAYARAAADILLDPDRAGRMGRKARAAMERVYKWETCLAPLDSVLECTGVTGGTA